MSLFLVQEIYREKRHVYFISKVFKSAETHYKQIGKLTLVVVIMARKLRPYFQWHKILVKPNYPVRKVLKNLDLA